MVSKILFSSLFTTSSIASVYSFGPPKKAHSTSYLQYRELNDESSFTKRQLPIGAFGILPLPTAHQDAPIDTEAYSFKTTDLEPFITQSRAQHASYSPNLDLPSSATKDLEFEEAIEISAGRIAMMAAIVLMFVEIVTGESFPQQFMQLIGGHL